MGRQNGIILSGCRYNYRLKQSFKMDLTGRAIMLLFLGPKHKNVPKIGVPCVFPIYLLWPKINCSKAFKKISFTECLREKYVNPENCARRRFSLFSLGKMVTIVRPEMIRREII